jgi:hypothetical protein
MTTSVEISLKDIDSVARGLSGGGESILSAVRRAVNTVAVYAEKESVEGVVKEVSLSNAYVSDRIYLLDGVVKNESVYAEVIGRYRPTRLATYIHAAKSRVNDWTETTFNSKFGVGGMTRPNPKAQMLTWTERTGNTVAVVAPGRKTDGVIASVKTGGGMKPISYAFLRQTSNGVGIFAHKKGSDKTQQLYGPSVHQVVVGVWDKVSDKIARRLVEEIDEELDKEVPSLLGLT